MISGSGDRVNDILREGSGDGANDILREGSGDGANDILREGSGTGLMISGVLFCHGGCVYGLFLSCVQDDCLVKIWYPCSSGSIGIGTPPTFSFCYVAHPQSVRGFVWRRVTPSLPR